MIVHLLDGQDIVMSEARSCCGHAYPALDPPLFSFNSPQGMCPECNGIGARLAMDETKVIPDPSLSIRQGAVLPWKNFFSKQGELTGAWNARQLEARA